MPESGEHDLFGVPFPMIHSSDLARAFQWWLRGLGQHPNLADTRRVTTLIRGYVRTFEDEDLELMLEAVPRGDVFEPLRNTMQLEQQRRRILRGE